MGVVSGPESEAGLFSPRGSGVWVRCVFSVEGQQVNLVPYPPVGHIGLNGKRSQEWDQGTRLQGSRSFGC